MLNALLAYGGLFLIALAAGSILPAQSEAVLAGLVVASGQPVALLVAVATIGNVCGAVINWLLGRGIDRYRDRRWFPASEATLDKARAWYQRYGRYSLLVSFVPIIGDPLTVVAGVMREPLKSFILLVALAKGARYILVAWLALAAFGG